MPAWNEDGMGDLRNYLVGYSEMSIENEMVQALICTKEALEVIVEAMNKRKVKTGYFNFYSPEFETEGEMLRIFLKRFKK